MKLLKLQELEVRKLYSCLDVNGMFFSEPHRINNEGNLEYVDLVTGQWTKEKASDILKSKYRFKNYK